MKLDQLDIKILELLQRNDMLTPKLSRIAKEVGSTNATIYRRVETLKKAGIIIGHTTKIDAGLVGRPLHCFIFLKVNKGIAKAEREEIAHKISKIDSVESIYVPMSKWNYIVVARHQNISELDKFIQDELTPMPFEEMQIELISRTIKEGASIAPDRKVANL